MILQTDQKWKIQNRNKKKAGMRKKYNHSKISILQTVSILPLFISTVVNGNAINPIFGQDVV